MVRVQVESSIGTNFHTTEVVFGRKGYEITFDV
jgi:hypothetical protein